MTASTATAGVVEFMITLDGDQHAPAVDTGATGMGTARLELATLEFTWEIEVESLSGEELGAAFHGPARLCEDAKVQLELETGLEKMGSTIVTEEQAMDILSGLWYVNVRSSVHSEGEIRGQVVPAPLDDPLGTRVQPGKIHIELDEVTKELTAPNWGVSVPQLEDRLFVTDQAGILWQIDLESGEKSELLDVRERLVELGAFGPGTFDERGLLGVAFHPKYALNGLLYTYTSEPADGEPDFTTLPADVKPDHQSVIMEWRVSEPMADPEKTSVVPVRELMRIDQPQFNHNAGGLAFGPDDLLYIALGDGGGADDRDGQISVGGPIVGHGCVGNGQDTFTILGNVLRIDPSGNDSANGRYGLPRDNPFINGGGLPEIYAFGFRNPFRLSFDRERGELLVPDVGQNDIEEINIVKTGGNYGWNLKEGTFPFIANGNEPGYVVGIDQAIGAAPEEPIAQYDHDDGIAIIGGFVYRGSKIPALTGRYVFGDFAATGSNDGRLFFLDENDEVREFMLVDQDELGMSLLGFGQDARGELYVLANSTGTPFGETGVVLRISTKTGDLNADGVVDVFDLLDLLAAFGECKHCAADLNDDGDVDVQDLLILLANFGS